MQIFDKITADDNLYAAWRLVRANQGGPGTDEVGLDEYEADLKANLADLHRRLRNETYVPLPLRHATLPKRDGGRRELAIPAVADRVAQRAFVNVLEGVFEPIFLPCSFGYRPRRGVADAVGTVLSYKTSGYDWILDADVQDFFPSVDHALLMERLRHYIGDRAILRTIGLWLEAGAMTGAPQPSMLERTLQHARAAAKTALWEKENETGWTIDEEGDLAYPTGRSVPPLLMRFGTEAARLAWENRRTLLPLLATRGVLAGGGIGVAVLGAAAVGQHVLANRQPRTTGTPQGGPISPLLSNVYLHTFDERMTAVGLRLVRYADDFVICCSSEARARQAQGLASAELHRLRLALHPEKTRMVACADQLRFLGYEFDRDGAFPVPGETAVPALESVKRSARLAGQMAGQNARLGLDAAKSGAQAASRAGADTAQEIAGRWRELLNQKR